MKKIVHLLLALFLSIGALAQVTNQGEPLSWSLNENSKELIQPIKLPGFDLDKMRMEDKVNDKLLTKPYRFGFKHQVDYGLKNSGQWLELDNGDRIWRILFESKNALSLNFIFDKFYMPDGGKVYLYNNDRSDLLGAYTRTQNQKNETLGTWLVEGDKVWIEYFEPKEVRDKGKLNISVVTHGYRSKPNAQKALGDSGDCNYDVDCSIGADFEDHKNELKKAVALILINGNGHCTGTLINNVRQDKKPYFLTANHCLTGPTTNWAFRFGWISPNPVCGTETASTNGPTNMTISGSTLIANNSNSDFALLELNGSIPTAWDRVWAGWDRTDNIPSFTVGIHHPAGDIMKVCRDNNPPIKLAQNAGGNSPIAQTWDITGLTTSTPTGGGLGWEIGVTEGGSSGSALFGPNGRIIGQLYGGAAACSGTDDNNGHDYYGRFAISWNGRNPDGLDRLRDWLDPDNLNPTTLDALDNNTLATNDEVLEASLSLFPNPTDGMLQVQLSNSVGELKYDIFNVLGQVLKSNRLDNNTIDLSLLPNDIYLVKITDLDRNASITKKIVLSK